MSVSRPFVVALATAAAVAGLATPARADTSSPHVESARRVSPWTVGGGATIEIELDAHDHGGGDLDDVQFIYEGPTGQIFVVIAFDVYDKPAPVTAKTAMRPWSATGLWRLIEIMAHDSVTNYVIYRRDGSMEVGEGSAPPAGPRPDFQRLDFRVENPNQDVTAPVLLSANLLYDPVPAGEPAVVLYTATDDRSGIVTVALQYESPTGNTLFLEAPNGPVAAAGPASWVVPLAAAGGLYRLSRMTVADAQDNQSGYTPEGAVDVSPNGATPPPAPYADVSALDFTVEPKSEDLLPPRLQSIAAVSDSPLHPHERIVYDYSATDGGTGVAEVWGRWVRTVAPYHEYEVRKSCGNPAVGHASLPLPRAVASGRYALREVVLFDRLGNRSTYARNGSVAGFPEGGPTAHALTFAALDFSVTAGESRFEYTDNDTTREWCPPEPDVRLTPSETEIEPGEPIDLEGAVTRGGAAVPRPVVAVYAFAGPKAKLVGVVRGTPAGRYRKPLAPMRPAAYKTRFLGAAGANPALEGFSRAVPVAVGARSILWISAQDRSTLFPGETLVRGKLMTASARALSGLPVRLLARRAGSPSWSSMATRATSSSGTVAFAVSPGGNAEYALRFAGDAGAGPAQSAIVTVAVRPRIGATLGSSSVAPGTRTTMSGLVSPAHAGARAILQRDVGGVWRDVSSQALNGASRFWFTLPAHSAGTYRYRVYLPAHADHAAGASPAATLTVT